MSKKVYTHIDKDNVQWRFEDGRPVSQIADEVVEEVFGQKTLSCEALPLRKIWAEKCPILDVSFLRMKRKWGNVWLPRFGIFVIRGLKIEPFTVELGHIGGTGILDLNDCLPQIFSTEILIGLTAPDAVCVVPGNVVTMSETYRDVCKYAPWWPKENTQYKAVFNGLIPDEIKKRIRYFSRVYEQTALVAEIEQWDVQPIVTDPLLVGYNYPEVQEEIEIHILAHFNCTPMEHYIKSEFIKDDK